MLGRPPASRQLPTERDARLGDDLRVSHCMGLRPWTASSSPMVAAGSVPHLNPRTQRGRPISARTPCVGRDRTRSVFIEPQRWRMLMPSWVRRRRLMSEAVAGSDGQATRSNDLYCDHSRSSYSADLAVWVRSSRLAVSWPFVA